MTSLTTKQKLSTGDGVYLAYFIDESAEIARWSAAENSTEAEPWVTVTVVLEAPAEYIEVNYTVSGPDGS